MLFHYWDYFEIKLYHHKILFTGLFWAVMSMLAYRNEIRKKTNILQYMRYFFIILLIEILHLRVMWPKTQGLFILALFTIS